MRWAIDERSRRRTTIGALALIYILAARFGLSLSSVGTVAASIWAPSGISLAALLVIGYRLWPGIAIGAFLVNLSIGVPVLSALGIAAGNTLEALIGAYLLQRVGFNHSMQRLRDVLALAGLAAGVSTLASATIGVISAYLGGTIAPDQVSTAWLTWWIGDAMGDLLIAPALLTWSAQPRYHGAAPDWIETFALTALTAVVVLFLWPFLQNHGIGSSYTIFPCVVWAALRFRQRGVASVIIPSLVVAIWHTAYGRGPFAAFPSSPLKMGFANLPLFMGVTALTGFILAAVQESLRASESRYRELYDRAKALEAERAELLAMVAHDIRGPLSNILNVVRLIRQGRESDSQLAEIVSIGERSAHSLSALVANYLELSRIDARGITLRKAPLNLNSLLTDHRKDFDRLAEHAQVSIGWDLAPDLPTIEADALAIERVVANLVENALKFTPHNGRVDLRTRPEDGFAILTVTDTGQGIAREELATIFSPYKQAQAGQHHGGYGLGLHIAKSLVEAHHGRIEVESEIGSGTCFRVLLPAAAAKSANRQAA